jgi:hypothetical protein
VTRSLAVAVCVAALCAVGSSGAVRPAAPAATGAVVFVANRPGPNGDATTDIYAVNLDGTGLTRLTHDGQSDSPLPSPDGKLIAFGASVMDRDGGDRRELAGCYSVGSWAPDSKRIACQTSDVGFGVVDLARRSLEQLSGTGTAPVWSPDGRSIAYAGAGLWVVDVATGKARRLSRRAVEGAASWSPDSKQLAFAVQTAASNDLYVVRADGSGEQRIAKGVESGSHALSPVDSRIAFVRSSPRGPLAVYTERADGSDVRLVSRGVAREASDEPAWSGDGKLLLYERQRYPNAYEDDVAATPAAGGAPRRLTAPFPVGGSNEEPRWLPGPRLPATPPKRPPTLTLPKLRTLTFASPLHAIAADDARALVVPDGCTFVVWAPLDRRAPTRRRLCDEAPIQEFVLSAGRLAWRASTQGNTEYFTELRAASVGARRAPIFSAGSSFSSDGGDTGASVSDLHGRGGTLAFTFTRWGRSGRSVWLLLPRRGTKCPGGSDWTNLPAACRRIASADGGTVADADASRIAVVADGAVRVVTPSGRLLQTVRPGGRLDAVRLDGKALVVHLGSKVVVYGPSTRTWQLAAGEGTPSLVDAHGELVLYTTGGAIHVLDTRSGKDRALALPRSAPPLDARLTASGLFVGWNRIDDPRPGRLSFVPLGVLVRAFRR